MEEPDGTIGEEGWSAADSPEFRGNGVAMTDPGEAGGTREPGRAEGMTALAEQRGRGGSAVDWSIG